MEAATAAPAWHAQLAAPVAESALKALDAELVFSVYAPGVPAVEFPVPLGFLTPFLQYHLELKLSAPAPAPRLFVTLCLTVGQADR